MVGGNNEKYPRSRVLKGDSRSINLVHIVYMESIKTWKPHCPWTGAVTLLVAAVWWQGHVMIISWWWWRELVRDHQSTEPAWSDTGWPSQPGHQTSSSSPTLLEFIMFNSSFEKLLIYIHKYTSQFIIYLYYIYYLKVLLSYIGNFPLLKNVMVLLLLEILVHFVKYPR